ncbi:GerAB/ArcD/ProY family transporter [Paenibacillus sp. DYY-L-2]|uniref:GerAB/ArcD/ProY family transporter n=1 Tax=Paenibacillus sp. DYY-L-2 TaxID=3447013 RepID=UPI003F4F9540
MNSGKSRTSELIASFVLYEIGSTTLFQIGASAKQDAWLAMLIGASFGFLLLLLYLEIHRREPEKDLFEICREYLGKWIGTLFPLILSVYFAYESSRNLRDLGELAAFVLLDRTPLSVIMLIAIVVVGNSARYGPHMVFLVCMVMLPMVIVSYLILIVMITSKGMLRFDYMLPVLENGFKPVWDAAFPQIVSFPFAQTMLYLVFFPLVKKASNLRRSVMIAYAVVALFLIVMNQINILVLGPSITGMTMFPLLQVVQLIEMAEVFERMDVLFVLVLFLGLGTKILIFYIGAATGFSRITGTSYKKWVIPVGLAIFGFSFLSPNFTHHLWLGIGVLLDKVDPYILMVMPALLLGVMILRRNKRRQK